MKKVGKRELNKILSLLGKNIGYIYLLLHGYISNGIFIIKDLELSEMLLKLYIEKEYKELEGRDDIKDKLMGFEEYYNKRISLLKEKDVNSFFTIKKIIEIFNEYNNNDTNILTNNFKAINENIFAIKLKKKEYFVLNKELLDLLLKIYNISYEDIYFLSKEHTKDTYQMKPIQIKTIDSLKLINVLIMPLNMKFSDSDFDNI